MTRSFIAVAACLSTLELATKVRAPFDLTSDCDKLSIGTASTIFNNENAFHLLSCVAFKTNQKTMDHLQMTRGMWSLDLERQEKWKDTEVYVLREFSAICKTVDATNCPAASQFGGYIVYKIKAGRGGFDQTGTTFEIEKFEVDNTRDGRPRKDLGAHVGGIFLERIRAGFDYIVKTVLPKSRKLRNELTEGNAENRNKAMA